MNATRAADERLLDWIKERVKGSSCAKVATEYGVSRALVYEQTDGVRQADIEHCGEKVRAAYW